MSTNDSTTKQDAGLKPDTGEDKVKPSALPADALPDFSTPSRVKNDNAGPWQVRQATGRPPNATAAPWDPGAPSSGLDPSRTQPKSNISKKQR